MKKILMILLLLVLILPNSNVNATESNELEGKGWYISEDGHTIVMNTTSEVTSMNELYDEVSRIMQETKMDSGFGGMFDVVEGKLEVSYTRSGVQNFSKNFTYWNGSTLILGVRITTSAWVNGSSGYLLSTTGSITEYSPFVSAYFTEMYTVINSVMHRCTVRSTYLGSTGDQMYYSTYQPTGVVTITEYQ